MQLRLTVDGRYCSVELLSPFYEFPRPFVLTFRVSVEQLICEAFMISLFWRCSYSVSHKSFFLLHALRPTPTNRRFCCFFSSPDVSPPRNCCRD